MKFNESYFADLKKAASAAPLESLQGKSVCITGATGLIGSAIADLLLYGKLHLGFGYDLTFTARSAEKAESRFAYGKGAYRPMRFVCGEPFKGETSFDYLIHCAENAHPQAFSAHPAETANSALAGAHELLEWTRRKGGRFCYLSSSEVYGKLDAEKPIGENDFGYVDLKDPRSCYPSAKRMIETLCACYRKEYGADCVIVRPGHIYGPQFTKEDSRVFAQFARDVLAGRDIVMKSEGRQMRSYCYTLDCASAILTVAVRGGCGEAYNISNRRSLATIRELAETFARLSGRKVVFDLPSEAERAGYNRMTYSALASEKLEALGWKGRFDLEAGVAGVLAGAD